MKLLSALILLFLHSNLFSQTKFKIVSTETNDSIGHFYLKKQNDKKHKILNKDLYLFSPFSSKYGYFAVVSRKDFNGWAAIDFNENILFSVYNAANNEPNPDKLIENKIRIIDANNKIGFADKFGKIVIKPQYESVTSFHNGKAIIADECSKVFWDNNSHTDGYEHYSIQCKNHGYIDKSGKIIKFGQYSFDEIQKQINWKSSRKME